VPQIGIVDLGSNNARMVVYEYEPGAWFRLVDVIREPVRLGEGLGASGEMTPEAIARGVACLDLFADYAAAAGLDDLVTVGTSALRDAANRHRFRRAIRHLGLRLHVLSGEEEARAGVLAVANGFELPGAWVVDLGGGSAQVSRMRRRSYTSGRAYPLGAVRLTESCLGSDPPRRSEVRALEAEVERALRPVAEAMRREPVPIVAMGGTIRNLARAAQDRSSYPLDLLHGYFLRRDDLERVTALLLGKSSRQRARLPGVSLDRADVIAAGALVYRWLLRAADRDGLFVSGHGVREGIFYRHFLPPPHLLPDVRLFAIDNLSARYGLDSTHSRHVRRLAGQLFEGLKPLHELGPREAQLLDAAAALHDLGVNVHYYRHPRHGAYVLAADPLPGFTHREHALLMQLVRYHHKGTPRLDALRPLAAPGDRSLLAHLSVCLRLAESLERSRASRVRRVAVRLSNRTAILRLAATEEPAVEVWEARKHADVFERAFGRRLVLETEPAAA
jgi:exopolyphosphatase/guanosine-5'-triphosphate,3'-diphosphate pyrophosphatase